MSDERIGLLVMAYGTASGPDDVEAYYTHIRRGSPPPPELLEELRRRYEAIGGRSPLMEITTAQMRALAVELERRWRRPVAPALGQKHAAPFVEDGVTALREAGVRRAVGIVLAPHYSSFSIEQYVARAQAAAGDGPSFTFVEDWHLAAGYVEWVARAVGRALATLPADSDPEVIFTAHSLPARIVAAGDPYAEQLAETAAAVADAAGLRSWTTAWQSAGRTGDEWLAPDVLDVMRARAHAGARAIVVCPCGFVSDHLEVLYDIDVDCAALAERLGIGFARTPSPNADPAFIAAVADVVESHTRELVT